MCIRDRDGDGKGPAVFILKEPGSGETVLEGYLYLDKFMDLKEMRRTCLLYTSRCV